MAFEIPRTATRIAFASSEPSSLQSPARWTELAVYHDPEDRDRPWIAISWGRSTVAGERTKEQAIQVGTLERALKLFDEGSQLGRAVRAEAEDWAERNCSPLGTPHVELERDAAERNQREANQYFADQDEALRWLYGDELDAAKPATLIARDFGAGESTVRAAIAAGREIKIPLTAALRFFDRRRFQAAREAARG